MCVCSISLSYLTACHPMECSPPDSSVRGIFQAAILEWVVVSFSRGSSWPRDQACLLHLFHWQVFLTTVQPWSPYFLYQVFNIFASIRTILQRIWSVKMLIFPKSRIRKCCSDAQSCSTLCNFMDRSMPGLPVHYQLPELAQTHLHWASDATQTFHPLSPLPPAFNLSQHQGLFKWVTSSYQVAKLLELQLQHQSFQWILRIDIL